MFQNPSLVFDIFEAYIRVALFSSHTMESRVRWYMASEYHKTETSFVKSGF